MFDDSDDTIEPLEWDKPAHHVALPMPSKEYFQGFHDTAQASSHFPKDRMQEVDNWVTELYSLVNSKVEDLMRNDHILIPDLETLDHHVARTSAEIFTVARTHVRLMRLLWEAERSMQRVKRTCARDRARTRAVISVRVREENEGRRITVAEIDSLVDADDDVQEEEERIEKVLFEEEGKYAEILEHERGTAAMLEALRIKAGLLSGLQGAKNAVIKSRS